VASFLEDLVDSHLEMSYLVEVSPLVALSHPVEEDLYPVVDYHQAMVDSDLEESHLVVELEEDLRLEEELQPPTAPTELSPVLKSKYRLKWSQEPSSRKYSSPVPTSEHRLLMFPGLLKLLELKSTL